MRLNTRPNHPNPLSRRHRILAGAVATALLAAGLSVGLSVARPSVAGADPAGTDTSAPGGDSLEAAASEVVALETTTRRLQRQHVELLATLEANRAETAATKTELTETKANRRGRAVRTYMKSFSGESLDDLLRPSVSGERLEMLTNAADRADQIGIKAMHARLAELADQLRITEAALQTNRDEQLASTERLDIVKAKLATATIGASGPVTPAAPGPGPIAKAARAAGDALRASDFAAARSAAALAAALATPTDPDAIAVAFGAAAEQVQPKAEHEAKQQNLAEAVDGETGADGSELAAVWASTPPPALQAMYFALSQVGKDYVYATSGPNSYDCSGLTRRAWAENQIGLPHFSGAQLHVGSSVAVADLRPGDLLAYGPDGSEHVVLYIGAGWDVEAKGAAWGVVVEKADTSSERYAGASRPIA
ncbi:MAG: NlpC/P60 family protein [Acidimicrobiia bacterium]